MHLGHKNVFSIDSGSLVGSRGGACRAHQHHKLHKYAYNLIVLNLEAVEIDVLCIVGTRRGPRRPRRRRPGALLPYLNRGGRGEREEAGSGLRELGPKQSPQS